MNNSILLWVGVVIVIAILILAVIFIPRMFKKKTEPTPASITLQPPDVTINIKKTGNPPKEGYREHYSGTCTFLPKMNEFITVVLNVKLAPGEQNARFIQKLRARWFVDTTSWSISELTGQAVRDYAAAATGIIPFTLPSHYDMNRNIVCQPPTAGGVVVPVPARIIIDYQLTDSSVWTDWYNQQFEYSQDIWSAFETITTGTTLEVVLLAPNATSAAAQNQIPYRLTSKNGTVIESVRLVPVTPAQAGVGGVYKFSYGSSIQNLEVQMVRLPFTAYNGFVALQKTEAPNNYLCYSNGAFSEVANWSDDCFFTFQAM